MNQNVEASNEEYSAQNTSQTHSNEPIALPPIDQQQELISTHILSPVTEYPDKPSKSIAIIYTGGTIGMVQDKNGQLIPSPTYLMNVLQENPIFKHSDMPSFMLYSMPPPVDSSLVNPGHWRKIAGGIEEIYEYFKGFVVIHGTDTMAYTASALSFMFENLQKHVVLTGSQLPMSASYTDGYFNLAGAMLAAAQLKIAEVTIFFCNKLMRGNRVQKYSSWTIDAFTSHLMPPLVEFGTSMNIQEDLVRNFKEPHYGGRKFTVAGISDKVGMAFLVPGMKAETLEPYLTYKGLILMVFGQGNGGDDAICLKLKQMHDRGMVIALVSQAHSGKISLAKIYRASNYLSDAGCISSNGMTPEAALTKLSYLVEKNMSQREIEDEFSGASIRGERD